MNVTKSGYIFTIVAITLFSIQDGISKHLAGAYPPFLVAMIRYWTFALFAIALAARSRGGLAVTVRTRRPWLQILRGLLLAAQIVIVIQSFAMVGLARSQAIFSSGPLIVALLSVPILGEKVGWRRWTAIFVGFLGVLLILKPESGFFDVRFLVPLSSALLFSFYVIVTRLVSRQDASMTSFFYTGVVGAIAMSCIGPFFWMPLTPHDWIWMGLLCLTGMWSHYCLIRAYDLLDAVVIQPLTYLQLVYAAIIGVVVFGEVLTANMVVGAAIVVAAGMFTVWRENVLAKRRAGH
ncbi:DMT family transporter [Rhizobium sp. VS19-DR104.2]|uniref:DMT family transporter n=1 Tax=unclassified Rhizobium TaxID=2613769 RepID=UPI001CC73E54|nr:MULTISPECIES: DMT family transporter [unclassified Rhizobium]MBZ5759713.1 DMT family transporter [Rhizobium sp. VS19-DR96]MBZ5766101.1 DMT family transporter [Rhizobium sp. VS19-DR129.2]MBZ5772884.1 DMT family transporter [Rhizobium sp. VS19-DRK62.2]MBZ5786624.1 DMT family transporter [Rhizobium sp. VS19-DR121]MBZ5804352.1 DMT family transporter [Rhizobium sp. VS19-DR181]